MATAKYRLRIVYFTCSATSIALSIFSQFVFLIERLPVVRCQKRKVIDNIGKSTHIWTTLSLLCVIVVSCPKLLNRPQQVVLVSRDKFSCTVSNILHRKQTKTFKIDILHKLWTHRKKHDVKEERILNMFAESCDSYSVHAVRCSNIVSLRRMSQQQNLVRRSFAS